MDSTRRSEYWEVKSEKISPQNIFPLVDTFPPNAMPFSFIMQREYFPQAVIAASVPIDHNGCKITSQNHFIARDHNFTCSTYNSQNQMIEKEDTITFLPRNTFFGKTEQSVPSFHSDVISKEMVFSLIL